MNTAVLGLRNWSISEVVWTALALGLVCVGSWQSDLLMFSAALTNVMCVILVAKGRISNYYWGFAGVLLYAIVAYKQGLTWNMWLNIAYMPMQVWGWVVWNKSLKTETLNPDVPVRRLTTRQLGIVVASITVLTSLCSTYSIIYTTNPTPFADAFTMAASIVAMVLMINKFSEQWPLWILVNCASIYMWVIPALNEPGAWALVATFTAFLISSLYGAYKWYCVKINK